MVSYTSYRSESSFAVQKNFFEKNQKSLKKIEKMLDKVAEFVV